MRKFLFCFVAILFCVSFTQAQSNQVKKQIIEQMIRNGDILKSCSTSVDVQLEYLDDDEQSGYVVSGNGSCCGGARRCNLWIYQKTAKGYKKIFGDKDGLQGDIEVLKTKTNGYRNIRSSMYSGDMTYQSVSKFNGRTYQVDKKTLKSLKTGF